MLRILNKHKHFNTASLKNLLTFISRFCEDSLRWFTGLAGAILIVYYDTELIRSVRLQRLHYKQRLRLLDNW